jgi:hypothetical protein
MNASRGDETPRIEEFVDRVEEMRAEFHVIEKFPVYLTGQS